MAGAASAEPSRLNDLDTPPETVHRAPVPAQIMHSRAWRRLTSSSWLSRSFAMISFLFAECPSLGQAETRLVEGTIYSPGGISQSPSHQKEKPRRKTPLMAATCCHGSTTGLPSGTL